MRNSISHDARVLKEANTLQEAGYDVTVVGIADRIFASRRETLSGGVKIVRVDTRKLSGLAKDLVLFLVLIVSAVVLWVQTDGIGKVIALIAAIGAILFIVPDARLTRRRASHLSADEPKEKAPPAVPGLGVISVVVAFGPAVLGLIGVYLAVCCIRPRILHCHDAIMLPIGVASKLTLKCVVVYDAHEIYEEVAQASTGRARVYKVIHKLCQRHVDGFVTINQSIADWYARHYPKLPLAVLVKNATNLAGDIEYDGRLHAAAGVARERKILLYQGGFSKKRGLEYLVQSARFLTEEWVLVMMGWGSLESVLRDTAAQINSERRERGQPESVVFIPPAPQQELALWTAGGTVGVIPYEKVGLNHWFCTPNKLWEYPNANLPVLVSPFPELSAPVREYGFGWLLPEEQDPEKLGRMVVALSDDEIVQARKNCKKFMAADNWKIYAERLSELYRDLIARHGLSGS